MSPGVYPVINLWHAGFRWQPGQPEYEQMIAVIYAVLGIFLIRASRYPFSHLFLIWFTVWSSRPDQGGRGDLGDDARPGELAAYCLHALTAATGLRGEDVVHRLVVPAMNGCDEPPYRQTAGSGTEPPSGVADRVRE